MTNNKTISETVCFTDRSVKHSRESQPSVVTCNLWLESLTMLWNNSWHNDCLLLKSEGRPALTKPSL